MIFIVYVGYVQYRIKVALRNKGDVIFLGSWQQESVEYLLTTQRIQQTVD